LSIGPSSARFAGQSEATLFSVEPADIRLSIGKRKQGDYDFIVIGQNGRDVALKTNIRLL
jgi:hypothetical protein